MNYYLVDLLIENEHSLLPIIVVETTLEEAVKKQLKILSIKSADIMSFEKITQNDYENIIKLSMT